MLQSVRVQNLNTHPIQTENISVELPRMCPNCRTAYRSLPLISYLVRKDESAHITDAASRLFSVYFCPYCESCFFVQYSFSENFGTDSIANILTTYPAPSHSTSFSDKVCELSSSFVKIYNQAEKAEESGLTEICGMGYRKALEFLVKDYAIRFHPEDAESICALPLSRCIDAYIDSDRIKTLAKASAWIGNDETHYTRKHEDYNFRHLKAFISAIVPCIDSELYCLEANALLSTQKNQNS